jgi:hypothetical protein
MLGNGVATTGISAKVRRRPDSAAGRGAAHVSRIENPAGERVVRTDAPSVCRRPVARHARRDAAVAIRWYLSVVGSDVEVRA